jgi:hypothetical protein
MGDLKFERWHIFSHRPEAICPIVEIVFSVDYFVTDFKETAKWNVDML